MKSYYTVLLIIGITSLIASFLPMVLKKFRMSFTIPLLLIGALMYFLKTPLPWPNPVWDIDITLRFSELVVIISLMVAGLKIGLNYSWNEWKNPLRLIGFTMPLFMLIVFLIAYYLLHFDGPVALLLAAVLAPTDPALASDIQLDKKQKVGSKNVGVQYNLTAEAGLNDSLAFPFVFLAILWSQNDSLGAAEWKEWLWYYLGYKIVIGVIVGVVVGFAYSFFTRKLAQFKRLKIQQAFVALSLTLISYGLAEILDGYGFLSVFLAGLFAHYHQHTKNETIDSDPSLDFITNVEQFLIIFWMIFFGGSLVGGILDFNTIPTLLFGVFLVLIARPLLGYISLYKSGLNTKKKWAIAFFGIRGIGSVFYLTYAIKHGNFEDINYIFSSVAFIILLSIVLHGFTTKRIMPKIDHN
ncbi:cation:proton antiporter [Winogradskyella sp. F6397]|uniref:Cation:proton antiporter n=1 Tax=Winogradskyella marina TaxID=2785530 RepID=A0ABS0EFQ2_9FLAO|nr:cation:proton antiporter [Winogradskyella marina]MBF8149252.1 cation:proton antiporter [Winogradskyella marina]